MSSELKPCPFCGGMAKLVDDYKNYGDGWWGKDCICAILNELSEPKEPEEAEG